MIEVGIGIGISLLIFSLSYLIFSCLNKGFGSDLKDIIIGLVSSIVCVIFIFILI